MTQVTAGIVFGLLAVVSGLATWRAGEEQDWPYVVAGAVLTVLMVGILVIGMVN